MEEIYEKKKHEHCCNTVRSLPSVERSEQMQAGTEYVLDNKVTREYDCLAGTCGIARQYSIYPQNDPIVLADDAPDYFNNQSALL